MIVVAKAKVPPHITQGTIQRDNSIVRYPKIDSVPTSLNKTKQYYYMTSSAAYSSHLSICSRPNLKMQISSRAIMARRLRLQREEVVKITEIAELALATRRRRRQAKLHGFERLVLKPPHPHHVLVRIDHRRRLGGRS